MFTHTPQVLQTRMFQTIFTAKSIEDRKQQLFAHYRDLLNSSNTKAVIAPRNPRNLSPHPEWAMQQSRTIRFESLV